MMPPTAAFFYIVYLSVGDLTNRQSYAIPFHADHFPALDGRTSEFFGQPRSGSDSGDPLPITFTHVTHLRNALCRAFDELGFAVAAEKTMMFDLYRSFREVWVDSPRRTRLIMLIIAQWIIARERSGSAS